MDQNAHNTRRIAKNTLVLYVRMLVLMLVGLYTSRVVLSALGENDFGIYDVVGGGVAMFTIISGSLNDERSYCSISIFNIISLTFNSFAFSISIFP